MEIIRETKEVTRTITETEEVYAGLRLNHQEARILAVLALMPISAPRLLFSDEHICAVMDNYRVSKSDLETLLWSIKYYPIDEPQEVLP